jgi:hypothetical protein
MMEAPKFKPGDVVRWIKPRRKSDLNKVSVFDRYRINAIPGDYLCLIYLKGDDISYFESRFELAEESIIDRVLNKYLGEV